MTKTKLIPFDYDRYKAGAKAVTRDGREIIELYLFQKRNQWPLLALTHEADGEQILLACNIDGLYLYRCDKDNDLMLEIPLEEKTFWVNLYSTQEIPEYIGLLRHKSFEDAKSFVGILLDCKFCYSEYKGTLKITYTEEDLIK